MGGFSMYKFSHGQMFSFLLGVYLGVELLGHMVTHFPRSSVGKEPACNADSWVRKIPWRKEMATHSSSVAWRIPWTEESGRL